MSEEANETISEEQPEEVNDSTDMEEAPDYESEIEKWKALSRKHEGQAKKNAEAAAKLQEIEESKKTDQDRLTEERDKAVSDYKQTQQELTRLRVAVKKGLTESQAKRLIGETEEELEADADELLSSFKTSDDEERVSLPRKPRERLPNGEPSKAEAESPSELAERISKRSRGY